MPYPVDLDLVRELQVEPPAKVNALSVVLPPCMTLAYMTQLFAFDFESDINEGTELLLGAPITFTL